MKSTSSDRFHLTHIIVSILITALLQSFLSFVRHTDVEVDLRRVHARRSVLAVFENCDRQPINYSRILCIFSTTLGRKSVWHGSIFRNLFIVCWTVSHHGYSFTLQSIFMWNSQRLCSPPQTACVRQYMYLFYHWLKLSCALLLNFHKFVFFSNFSARGARSLLDGASRLLRTNHEDRV